MKYSIKFLMIIIALSSCNTVEEDEAEPAVSTDSNGNVVSRVEESSFNPTDSVSFASHLTDTNSITWKTSLFTLNGSTTFTRCRLDDIMLLFSDGKYTYQGGTLCGAEDNLQNRNGTWEIDYDSRKIFFDRGSNNEYVADVIGLSDKELRVKGSYMGMEVRGLYLKQ